MKPSTPNRWRRILAYATHHRQALGIIIILTIFVGAISVSEPLILKLLVDALADGAEAATLMRGILLLLVVGTAKEALAALNNWLTWKTRIAVQYELLSATVSRLHSLPLSFHQASSVGATMTKLERGVQGVVAGLSEIAFNVLPALIYVAFATAVMLQLSWKATLVVAAFVPLPAIVGALAAPEQIRRERSILERWSNIYSRFNEVLAGILMVKTFAREDAEKERFLGNVEATNRIVVRGVRRDSAVNAAKNLVVVLARGAALAASAWLVLRGELTVGTVVAFIGYVTGMFAPVQGLVGIYQTVRTTSVSLDTVLDILDAQDSLGDVPNAEEVTEVGGHVRFDNVSFSYDRSGPSLNRIHLEARPGEMVALVGPSGSGKTTLMALMQRIYDPCYGRILLDNKDIRRLKQRSLRKVIGVVLQDPMLLNDSIRNNITYGKPEASESDMLRCARATHVDKFVKNLPDGYDTLVGERGCKLSAGQRQRIAIARALLKDPPILILDEATSALDAETEASIQEALKALIRGRTTFVIAHRLSTIAEADKVVVLQDGRIAQEGTHQQLLRVDGLYSRMVRRQTEGLAQLQRLSA